MAVFSHVVSDYSLALKIITNPINEGLKYVICFNIANNVTITPEKGYSLNPTPTLKSIKPAPSFSGA